MASVDHGREPCPHRILDDLGGAFAMGGMAAQIPVKGDDAANQAAFTLPFLYTSLIIIGLCGSILNYVTTTVYFVLVGGPTHAGTVSTFADIFGILASCLAAGLGETTGPVGPPNTLHTATLVYSGGEPGGGGDIFNCATLDWAHGLRTSGETATITRNVLRRFAA